MSDPAPASTATLLEPSVSVVVAPNPGPMTLEGTNTYLVGAPGSGAVVVVDPGPADDAHRAAVEAAAAARGARIGAVVLTHHHPDHATAVGWAAAWRVPVWCHRPDMVEVDAEPLADRQRLPLAGVALHAVHTPGHSSDHVCLQVEGSGAVLTGDHVLGRGSTVVAWPDGDMVDYLASLERLRALWPSVLYPGHGQPVGDPDGAVDALLRHRVERERQILEAVVAGASTPTAIVARVYADVAAELWPAAERSVRAHLDKLVAEGRVRPHRGSPAVEEYRAV